MANHQHNLLLILALCLLTVSTVKIEKGWLTLDVVTGDNREDYKIEYSGHLKETLTLTQSSKINIKAKVQLFSYR